MLRKVSSYIVSMFLFVSISLFIVSMSSIALLDFETYDEAFTETGGYYEAEELFGQVGYALTPDEQRTVLENMLDYMQGGPPRPIVVQKGFTDAQVHEWIDAMPVCDGTVELCKPEGADDTTLFNAARQQFDDPQQIDLLEDTDPSVKEQIDSARTYLQHIHVLTTTTLIIALVSMLLILFLNRRYLKSGLRWIDSDLIVAGASSVITSVALMNQIPVLFEQATTDIHTGAAIIKGAYLVLSSVLGAMLWYGIGALVLGFVILIISIFVPNAAEENPHKKLARKRAANK